jgi:hypothetical protein
MKTEIALEQIREHLGGITDLYNRLLLVVGRTGAGKTTAIQALGHSESVPVLQIGADISRRLLELTERQRILELPRTLEQVVSAVPPELTLLDNTEVLFDPTLKQDPLRLLQRIARNRTVVATWLGEVIDGHLTYASLEYPEFRRYSTDDLLIVTLGDSSESVKVEQ